MKKKVMIVDDDKDFLAQLEELLDLTGYEMVAVNDTALAIEAAIKNRPNIILLDLKMPGKNGFQIAEELRQLTMFQDLPIITMTGFYNQAYEPMIEMLGIKRCLKKPLKPLDVISEIEFLLK